MVTNCSSFFGISRVGFSKSRKLLRKVSIIVAKLEGADLKSAHFEAANLKGANLINVDFRGAINLTSKQVKEANNWEEVKYSEDFRAKLGLQKTSAQ